MRNIILCLLITYPVLTFCQKDIKIELPFLYDFTTFSEGQFWNKTQLCKRSRNQYNIVRVTNVNQLTVYQKKENYISYKCKQGNYKITFFSILGDQKSEILEIKSDTIFDFPKDYYKFSDGYSFIEMMKEDDKVDFFEIIFDTKSQQMTSYNVFTLSKKKGNYYGKSNNKSEKILSEFEQEKILLLERNIQENSSENLKKSYSDDFCFYVIRHGQEIKKFVTHSSYLKTFPNVSIK